MQVFYEIDSLRHFISQKKSNGLGIGLVPTMGALHEGHAALVNQSIKDNDITICSIFVNPKQFDNNEDLEKYPRNIEEDLSLLKDLGCDVVFCPQADEIYSDPVSMKFDFGRLENVMEAVHRPGHFNGVALVVCKLFNIVDPDIAYFGQKDLQQLRIIELIVRDLSFGLRIRSVPIVREINGLAMSSRNARLTEEGRLRAVRLNQTLETAEKQLKTGCDFHEFKYDLIKELESSSIKVDYFELVDNDTLMNIENKKESKGVALCIAAFIDNVRLIDNRIF